MDFRLNDNQKMVQDMVRDFARNVIEPQAAAIDESGEFPMANIKEMAKLGLLGMVVPEQYGGAGFDFVSLAIAVEEISRACASTGVITAVNNSLVCYPLHAFGSEELKTRLLRPLAAGEKLGCYCLTEPNAGSDPAGIETTVKADGDDYVLNGTKRFITNAGMADVFIVFATHDKLQGNKAVSAFAVEKGMPGLSVGKHENLMGMRATANTEVILEDCRVPKANLLGTEKQGFKIAMHVLDCSRIDIGAQAVGIAQAALDKSLVYAKERKQFGKAIAEFEMIQEKFAAMATKIAAARWLVYHAAFLKDSGAERFTQEASMAKYFAADMAVEVTREAVQIHGGYGYSKDYAVERYYRDAKCLEIYEGTAEMQKIVIARSLLR
jgi:alkylation response protein AidB-like acyl-CoA dehydrogenase